MLAASALLGCDRGGTYPRQAGPPPRVLGTSLSLLGTPCGPVVEGRQRICDVKLRPLVVIRFDRVLADSAAARINYRISSGSVADVVFRRVRVDPVERTVVLSLDAPLQRGTLYRLRIKSSDAPNDRLASFDGTPFQGEYVQDFMTKAVKDPLDTEDVDLDPAAVDPCEIQALFAGACAGCHGLPKTPVDAVPTSLGLVLTTPLGLQETAIGHASRLVQRAANPGSAGAAPLAGVGFPRGLPLVDPREGGSVTSFLLYKLMMAGPLELERAEAGDGSAQATLAAPLGKGLAAPDGDPKALWRRTADDLAAVVPGSHMPSNGAPLTLAQLRAIRAWIDGAGGRRPAELCGTGDAGADAAPDSTGDAAGDSAGADAATDAASDAPGLDGG